MDPTKEQAMAEMQAESASANNLSNAALASRIEALGADAVALAKGAGLGVFG